MKTSLEYSVIPANPSTMLRRRRPVAGRRAGAGISLFGVLLFFEGQRYRLEAWVVMPNHVHVLFQPTNGWTMSKSVASWKVFTGRKISEWRMRSGLVTDAQGGPVWQREYYDRFIRDENHYESVVAYIRDNPVKAGLVARAEDWKFSSAGYDRRNY